MFKSNLCIDCGRCASGCPAHIHRLQDLPDGSRRHQINHEVDCIGCRTCEKVCPNRAISIAGEDKTISEVMKVIEEDMTFYKVSGGGVTLGGGEVLAQPEFAVELLKKCKRSGIHCAIETSGFASLDVILRVAAFTDLFLYDIKQIDSDKHDAFTGVYNEQILENLRELICRGYPVKVRMPLIKGVNEDKITISDTIKFLDHFKSRKNFLGVDLLPYHKLGVGKYEQIGKTYFTAEDRSLSEEDISRIEASFKSGGFPVKVIRH